MAKYVWAFFNQWDQEITMNHGEFNNEVEALEYAVNQMGIDTSEETFETAEDVKQFAFDYESMVGAYCVS